MKNTIIPLNALPKQEILERGQQPFISAIAKAGAYGVEIRRELFTEEILPLEEIRQEVKNHQLFTVYSAPVEIWLEDGSLNVDTLTKVYGEAQQLGAKWLKTSLGHYQEEKSTIQELGDLLRKLGTHGDCIELLVENDQTLHGGNIKRLFAFFVSVRKNHIPIHMTFDIGNWQYSGEDIEEALDSLAEFVSYVHLKHVERKNGRLVTLPLPLNNQEALWRRVLSRFPSQMVKALEFPIELKKLSEYLQNVDEEA